VETNITVEDNLTKLKLFHRFIVPLLIHVLI